MTGQVLLATLGQRPEAITMALDALQPRIAIQTLVILHTEPQLSGIAPALEALRTVLATDYPELMVDWCELICRDGAPLLDIHDQRTAEDYYHAIYAELLRYKQQRDTLHLLVAGGRKAMSIYATLAAGLLFTERDRVWTVLSPPRLIQQPGVFHAPDGLREQVQLVQLPLLPSRLLLGSVPDDVVRDPNALVNDRQSRRVQFLQKLTTQERLLAETIAQHRYDSNQELADLLHKGKRTVEAQLRSIYDKLSSFLDYGEQISNKRQALLDLLLER